MKFKNFRITAIPNITDAYCECGAELIEVSNGFLSSAMFCPKCENVYQLKLVKMPIKKVSIEFINQCKKDL